jgi:hypothetical protein
MRFRNHPVAHTPVEPTNIGSSSLLADLPTTYASRHFAFARNDYAPTASSGHPLTGPRNPRGSRFALVLQVGALATSVSGSLRQGPGIGLAPASAHLQSPGHCQSHKRPPSSGDASPHPCADLLLAPRQKPLRHLSGGTIPGDFHSRCCYPPPTWKKRTTIIQLFYKKADPLRKCPEETRLPAQKLFMGSTHDTGFFDRRFGMPPMRRSHEDPMRDPSIRSNS